MQISSTLAWALFIDATGGYVVRSKVSITSTFLIILTLGTVLVMKGLAKFFFSLEEIRSLRALVGLKYWGSLYFSQRLL